ncbi:unnamed protein product [Paramecium sonneborni]|uniref:Uncharacterized protein n=1 Tax=Paramecium sonneborni TaxID=65129 RepID=A0A8S1PNM5_9CILI|nr:unnamed protein product [Paramecium sonneborni]
MGLVIINIQEQLQFQIIKNLWNIVISVKFHGIQVDTQIYLSFQKQIHSQMTCKLNYKNLLYKIFTFQFIFNVIKVKKLN